MEEIVGEDKLAIADGQAGSQHFHATNRSAPMRGTERAIVVFDIVASGVRATRERAIGESHELGIAVQITSTHAELGLVNHAIDVLIRNDDVTIRDATHVIVPASGEAVTMGFHLHAINADALAIGNRDTVIVADERPNLKRIKPAHVH